MQGAYVTVTFPRCFTGSVVPMHAAGGWGSQSFHPGVIYTFTDSADVDGFVSFDWGAVDGPDPIGGCIPVDLLGPHGSCADSIHCEPATVNVLWDHGGVVRCGSVKRSIVSPDLASTGRMCDDVPWAAADSVVVGLEDAVEFTPPLVSGDYDPCMDLNGDGKVNAFDATVFTPYAMNGIGKAWSVPAVSFYGDSLNLPLGIGDDQAVLEHATTLRLVEIAIDSAEARGYSRAPEGDKVESYVTSTGVQITDASLGFTKPDSMSLPDSVVAFAKLRVWTSLANDTLRTSVSLNLIFVDYRNSEIHISSPGDSLSSIATGYEGSQYCLTGVTQEHAGLEARASFGGLHKCLVAARKAGEAATRQCLNIGGDLITCGRLGDGTATAEGTKCYANFVKDLVHDGWDLLVPPAN
ncbi:MAG: hypothetical protein K1Y02_25740 [Candidatus Hydrogenedentes bacterium]|nr:hypothetical protein [Candidatus Hydrogenedentota bacterium]